MRKCTGCGTSKMDLIQVETEYTIDDNNELHCEDCKPELLEQKSNLKPVVTGNWIWSNGCKLTTMKCTDGKWRWTVQEFEDECYEDGHELKEPNYLADTEEGLFNR